MTARRSAPRTAWLRTENGLAIICAWCPDKVEAEARAARAGLKCSHGVCPECAVEHFDEKESEAAS